MNDLQQARQNIGEIDKKMAELFVERMHCAEAIAKYKSANGLPIYDPVREKELLENNSLRVEDIELRPYYTQYLQAVMDISKKYQHKIIEGAKIAYSGIEGAFANIAATKLFPDGEQVSCRSFKEAYNSVVTGDCDVAVLPIENSHAGEVGQVMDLLFDGPLYVNGVYPLHISQNLLAVKGSSIDDIKTVISHPQALDQCDDYISKHGFATIQAANTARAAKEVAQKNDKSVAAIASKETADIYGLQVLDHDINEDYLNTTKFAVVSKTRDTAINTDKNSTYILMFTVKHEAGGLANAINVIGNSGYSMRVLKSRPLKDQAWQYYFYVEVEGELSTDKGNAMLKELGEHCGSLKVLGAYNTNAKL